MSDYGSLPETGYVRLPSIILPKGPIPVSKSTWWEGVRDGRFPKPVKLGPRITAWRVEDIRELIDSIASMTAELAAEPLPPQQQLGVGVPLSRQAKSLRARGERPLAEVLGEALRRLPLADRTAMLDLVAQMDNSARARLWALGRFVHEVAR